MTTALWRRLCGAWIALLAAALAAPGSASAQATGRFVEITAPSRVIAAPRVTIWLPPYYDQRSQRHRRYGVVYMNDGRNVFAPARAPGGVWAADRAVIRLLHDHAIDPVIVVAIDQPAAADARYRQYFPQALYARASPELRARIDADARGPLTGDAYVRFLTKELKPRIDRQFRTRRDPQHTAVVGASMGALSACYAFVQRPWVIGRAACVSTHWPLVDGNGLDPEIASLWDGYFHRNLGRAGKRRLWMDHGTETLDARYAPWQDAIDGDLTRRGWVKGDDFESRTFPGAAHDEGAWAARLDVVLAWLLRPKT